MVGREEPLQFLYVETFEYCILTMKILVAFYALLFTSYMRTIFGRPTSNSTSKIDIMATLQRSKREFLDNDYDDYYDELELEILESKNELLQKSLLPPDLPVSSNVRSNIQLLRDSPKYAPEYMMDLYKTYSEKRTSRPSSDIVRSFTNINIGGVTTTPASNGGKTTRLHTMVFNITSISVEEQVDLAELRLFTLVERDRYMYIGVDRKVSVYEVTDDNVGYHLIDTQHIYGRDSGWETFDVTSAVRRWVTKPSSIQILEIRIESVFHSVTSGDLDVLTTPQHKNEPLLVVFSTDKQKIQLHKTERHELIAREDNAYNFQSPLSFTENIDNSSNSNSSEHEFHNRVKRRTRRSMCRRKPMTVNFADIQWDTWILAPASYEAYECVGKCHFPVNERLSPSKHAIIQSRLHLTMPKTYPRESCCVPTKLDSISILYFDESGVLTYKPKYDGMVVTECGCR
ncbi:bone morphogenetic protein 10-like [Saccostrea cucullata]|uniref:bone morphogenetic protein 10-like n=1 Tax=Saccostrea cuccullata TaxID=36930 RepID=UPI002ED5E6DF